MIFLLIPSISWTFNGAPVTYSELWRSGGGASVFALAACVGIGSWGMAAKIDAARWAFVAIPIAPFAAASLCASIAGAPPAVEYAAPGVALAAILEFPGISGQR
jgi:hypothetical protein